MKIFDFKIRADAETLINMGQGMDDEFRCRTNNDGCGLFIGAGNDQILDNGNYPTMREIRYQIRRILTERWQINTWRYCDNPKFRLFLK